MSSSLQKSTWSSKKLLLLQQASLCMFKVTPTTGTITWPQPKQVLPYTYLVPWSHILLWPRTDCHWIQAEVAAAAAVAAIMASLEKDFIFSYNGGQVPPPWKQSCWFHSSLPIVSPYRNHCFIQNLQSIFPNEECSASVSSLFHLLCPQV